MTLPMARDLGKYKIRVVAVQPGIFSTPMTDIMP
jgi:NAD(P)-dependent dehydrogenase (short-subunit alcohol dehydrogenase family)